jgi:hypothetical protein
VEGAHWLLFLSASVTVTPLLFGGLLPCGTGSNRRTTKQPGGIEMMILGVILAILGLVLSVPVVWIIGIVLIVIGAILWIAGAVGNGVGGRRHYY